MTGIAPLTSQSPSLGHGAKQTRTEPYQTAQRAPEHPFIRKFLHRDLFLRQFTPFLDDKSARALYCSWKLGVNNSDKAIRLKELILSRGSITLAEFFEYCWLTGKTPEKIALDELSFTAKIRRFDLRGFHNQRLHPEVQQLMPSADVPLSYDFLSRIVRCFPGLERLTVSGRRLQDDSMRCLPELLPGLKDLNVFNTGLSSRVIPFLVGCRVLENLNLESGLEGLTALLKECQSIRSLTFRCNTDVLDVGAHREQAKALSPLLSKVSSLSILGIYFNDDVLQSFANHLSNLTKFEVEYSFGEQIEGLTAQGVLAVAQKNPNLVDFYFPQSLLDDALLKELIRLCPQIVPDLDDSRITPKGLDTYVAHAIKRPDQFTSLNLCDTNLKTRDLITLPKRMPFLINFSCESDHLNDALLHELIACCPKIVVPSITRSLVTRKGVMELVQSAIKRPAILRNAGLHLVDVNDLTKMDVIHIARNLPFLIDFSFHPKLLDDEVLEVLLTSCPRLQNLEVNESLLSRRGIHRFIQAVKHNRKLLDAGRTLNLAGTSATREDLMSIPRELPWLRHFIMDSSLLDDDLLREIFTHCNNLQEMEYFDQSKITDKGIQYILQFAESHPGFIERCSLDFSGTQVTVRGLKELIKKYPNEKYYVNGSHISHEQYHKLCQDFPDTEIIFYTVSFDEVENEAEGDEE